MERPKKYKNIYCSCDCEHCGCCCGAEKEEQHNSTCSDYTQWLNEFCKKELFNIILKATTDVHLKTIAKIEISISDRLKGEQ